MSTNQQKSSRTSSKWRRNLQCCIQQGSESNPKSRAIWFLRWVCDLFWQSKGDCVSAVWSCRGLWAMWFSCQEMPSMSLYCCE